jgi:hypothetical protein
VHCQSLYDSLNNRHTHIIANSDYERVGAQGAVPSHGRPGTARSLVTR